MRFGHWQATISIRLGCIIVFICGLYCAIASSFGRHIARQVTLQRQLSSQGVLVQMENRSSRLGRLSWISQGDTMIGVSFASHRATLKADDLAPLLSATDLRKLDLSSTTLDNSALEILGKLNGIERLDLSNARWKGNIKSSLGGLSNLRVLMLSGASLQSGDISFVQHLNKLEVLMVAVTRIDDTDLVALDSCRQLRVLDISGNCVTAKGIQQLQGLENLEQLFLTWSEVDLNAQDFFEQFPRLEELWFSNRKHFGDRLRYCRSDVEFK